MLSVRVIRTAIRQYCSINTSIKLDDKQCYHAGKSDITGALTPAYKVNNKYCHWIGFQELLSDIIEIIITIICNYILSIAIVCHIKHCNLPLLQVVSLHRIIPALSDLRSVVFITEHCSKKPKVIAENSQNM